MGGIMARARGSNTGKGNYPAGKVPGSAAQFKKGLEGIPKTSFPNRNLSTTQYKKTLRKEAESDA